MKDYKILIKLDNGTTGTLDLFQDTNIEIVYQSQDISSPETRRINFIREFTIPGTKNNLKYLRPLFDNGYTVEQLNPNKGIKSVFTNNNITFDGILGVTDIIQKDTNITFKVAIYSSLADFFNKIKGKSFFGNISLSEYNHRFNINNIKNSWYNKIVRNNQEIQTENGIGYVYPMEDRGVGISVVENALVFEADKWRPSIFVKTLVDKIFQKYGFTYESEFFESQYFRSFIMPFSRERLIPSYETPDEDGFTKDDVGSQVGFDVTNTQLLSTYNTTRDLKSAISLKYGSVYTKAIKDPNSNFNLTTQEFTVLKSGKYILTNRETFRLNFNYSGDFFNKLFYIKFRYSGSSTNVLENQRYPTVYASITKNGQEIAGNFNNFTAINPSQQYREKAEFTKVCSVSTDTPIQLLEGDIIKINYTLVIPQGGRSSNGNRSNIFWRSSSAPSTDNHQIQFRRVRKDTNELESSFAASIDEENEIGYGDFLYMNNALPDMNMDMFFRSLNKLFNLQWTPLSSDRIKIEPYNTHFRNRTKKDWTKLVDRNLDKIITPMSELSSLEYNFSYESDSDWANNEYELDSDIGFGARRIEIENDFLEGSTEIVPNFSSTPLTELELGSGNANDELGTQDFIIPSYTRKDDNGVKTPIVPKPRILFWGGMVNSPEWDLRVLESVTDKLEFVWLERETFTQYPYAGHLNSPIAPTQDLSYGVPKRFFHKWQTITNSNLFNLFWRNWITNIVDPKSHLLTVTLKLNDVEINNFNFTDLIQIDNSWYNPIEIVYDPKRKVAIGKLLKNIVADEFTPMLGYSGLVGMKFASTALTVTNKVYLLGATHSNFNLQSPVGPSSSDISYIETPSLGNYFIGNELSTSSPTLFDYNDENQGTIFPYSTPSNPLFRQGEDFLPLIINDNSFMGNGNSYLKSSLVSVKGFNNRIIGKPNGAISISGNQNIIHGGSANISIVGNRNIVEAGLRNVTIVGDAQTATESDMSYINGAWIKNGVLIPRIDFIEGGTNEVQNPFSPIKTIWKIEGGFNSVQNLGSDDFNDMIIGD